jgi:hypothetical protein
MFYVDKTPLVSSLKYPDPPQRKTPVLELVSLSPDKYRQYQLPMTQ